MLSKRSLRQRFGLLLGLIALAGFVVFGLYSRHLLQQTRAEFEQRGALLAETVASEAVLNLMMRDAEGLREQLDRVVARDAALGGVFFDAAGEPLAEAGSGVSSGPLAEAAGLRYAEVGGVPALIATALVLSDGQPEPIGTIRLAVSAERLEAQEASAMWLALGALALVAALGAFAFWLVGRTVVQPLQRLREAAHAVEDGDLSVQVEIRQQDEIGALADSFNQMVRASRQAAEALEERTAEGERARDAAEALQREAAGARERLQQQVEEISAVVAAISAGDLTRHLHAEGDGPVSVLMHQLNRMTSELARLIRAVASAGEELSESAATGSASAETIARQAEGQAAHAADVAAAVEEMSMTIADAARHTREAREMAQHAAALAGSGEGATRATADGMDRIAQIVTESADRVTALGTSSEEVGRIAEVIRDIAEQTNLLALNAAIEAARAGEQGRGFAVVADEVRKLAERTGRATEEIGDVIARIQRSTQEVVTSMRQGSDEVQQGLTLAQDAAGSLAQITEAVAVLTATIDQMAAAGEQQAVTSAEIARNVEAISDAAADFSRSTQEIDLVTNGVEERAQVLRRLIAPFRVGETEAPAAPALSVGGDGAAFAPTTD